MSSSEGLLTVSTEAAFRSSLLKANSNSALIILNFWAEWAEPCKHMNEVFAELAKKYKTLSNQVLFISIEAESLPDVSVEYEIDSVPTFIIIKNGKIAERVSGANAPALTSSIEKHIKLLPQSTPTSTPTSAASTTTPSTTTTTESKDQLQTRIKSLINSYPVMLFMKGTPDAPRCGFSRQSIDLLNSLSVSYGTFNILTDDSIRSGLKEYSNWPTYPQLYVNGELLGGLDIMKEMAESGELQSMLPKEEDLNSKLKRLINQSPVMLFMKGTPNEPRCGFSRQTISLLNTHNILYKTFDILSDDDVRSGLKEYSNWPTYPQLYVNGELVGGLDILKEMSEAGELVDLIPKECIKA